MKIAVIGGGLAGLSVASALIRYVSDVMVCEAGHSIAYGASGNDIGLVNPRLSAFRTPESDYYVSAFAGSVQYLDSVKTIVDWHKCGALHLITDEKKDKRFTQALDNWGWSEDHMRLVKAEAASNIAGVGLEYDALYLPDSGFLSPRKLCDHYADGLDVRLNSKVERLSDLNADIIIIACGNALKDFEETKDLPIQSVRGQITQVKQTSVSAALKCNLNYGGYCTPSLKGTHTIGATFQRWLDHSDLLPDDDTDNILKLSAVTPQLAKNMEAIHSRASLRCASKDHFPIVGRLEEYPNIYISAAHGSHGIISSFAAARLIADMILDRPYSQSMPTVRCLSPQRFSNPK